MEFVLAFAALGVGFVLARRGYLHPYDYVVAAALALLLAVSLLPALPGARQAVIFNGLGAPQAAVARDAFLSAHGLKIVVASVVAAAGACLEAWVRARRGGWDAEYDEHV